MVWALLAAAHPKTLRGAVGGTLPCSQVWPHPLAPFPPPRPAQD